MTIEKHPPLDDQQQQLLEMTRQLLQEKSEHLDLKTMMGLEKSRQQALKISPATPPSNRINADGSIALSKYLPGSLIAVSLLLALSFYTLGNDPVTVESPLGLFSDVELLGAQEPLEFYQDIEFYEWLELDE